MAQLIDLTGQRFGRLTVLERAENTPTGQAKWRCVCDCGNRITSPGQPLRDGRTTSCGCSKYQKASARAIIRNTTHGKSHTRLYSIWQSMKDRCYNPNHTWYKRYGGRGINICDEWLDDFEAFYTWAISHGYADHLTIDRIDNDGNYTPTNCRWATRVDQINNRSYRRAVCIEGVEKSLAEWCRDYNKDYYKVHDRLRHGWTIEEALDLITRKK